VPQLADVRERIRMVASQQRARDLSLRDRYIGDAEQMAGQIRALRHALGPKGDFKDALKKRLGNVERVLAEQMTDLGKAEAARSASLDADARNNEIAAGDSTLVNDANRIRERASAISEAMAQGAGESDSLKAQTMSLRSGAANQNEINRAFHDSQRSINASRLDLALDTHNARVNMVTEANADKEQLWTTFYNQSSETQTQLGNALGQQAEYYGLALEAGRNAGAPGGKSKSTSKSSSSSTSGSKGGKATGGPLRTWHGEPVEERGGALGRVKAGTSVPGGIGLGAVRGDEVEYDEPRGGLRFDSNLSATASATSGGKGGKGRRRNFGKGLKGDEARSSAQSDRAFMAAAKLQGRSWKNPGLTQELEDWQAPQFTEEQLSTSSLANARTTVAMAKPEGATLRKW